MAGGKINMISREQLLMENKELRTRLEETEQTLQAIQQGEVDALIIQGPQGEQVYSLTGAERIYRSIIETMNEAALTVSLDATIIFCNQRFSDLLNLSMYDVVGRKVTEFVEVSYWPDFEVLMGQARTMPARRRILLRSASGVTLPAQFSASPLTTDPEPCICMVASDLSELESSKDLIRLLRKQYRELKASREQLRLAKESARIGIYDHNLRTGEKTWDERIRQLWDLDQDVAMTDEHFWARIHPQDSAAVKSAMDVAFDPDGSGEYSVEYRLRVREGDPPIWISSRGRVFFERGAPARLIGALHDITERKRSEEALQENKARLEAVFAAIPHGVIEYDTHLRPVRVNAAALRSLGFTSRSFTRDQAIAKLKLTALDGSPVKAEDLPSSRALQGERVEGEEHAITTADGSHRVISTHAVPLYNEGRISGAVALWEDVTERKRAEESLRQLNQTLEQKVAERTELAEARSRQLQALAVELVEAEERERRRVAQLLHDDLQQILAAARFQLQGARANLPSEPTLESVEQILEESIGKARRLSRELSPPVLHHSGLAAALQALAGQMREQFGLLVRLESDLVEKAMSAPLKVFLYRAVQELLFNVVKHAKVKNARVILSNASDGPLTVTVTDQGQGFSADLPNSSMAAATGFGLLSLRERARYIGGSLAIQSAPGKGSRLTLTVPLNLEKADTMERPAADQQPSRPAAPVTTDAGGIRVLFVDDHLVMRQGLIRLMAGQPDIQVAGEASGGREAIEQARLLKPDLVIMDVNMPGVNGIEATRRIKAELPEVRVIGLSMYEDEQIARSMREAGAEAFVSKTASSGELLNAIYRFARTLPD